jgi:type I restriction enzyme S subunit
VTAIPKGWTQTTLGAISASPQYGWTTSARKDAANTDSLKFLRTTDITHGQLDWETVPYCKDEPPRPEQYLLASGDIVISRAGSVGFSYRVIDVQPAVFASYLIRFRPSRLVDGRYVAYFLQSPRYWDQVRAAAAGIALANVNAKKLAAVELPLAPRAEQERIVAAIEKQFSRLDAGVATVERVRQTLKRMRSAVLQAAVTGQLVSQDSTDESAHALLRRIQEARAALERSGALRKRRARPDSSSSQGLFSLPTGWVWANLDDLCQLENGDRSRNYPSKSQRVATGIPFINAGHLREGHIDMDSMDYISAAKYEGLRAGKVTNGDILFCIRGSLGKVAVVSDIDAGAIASSLVIVRAIGETLPRYVLSYLSSPLAGKMIARFDNGTAQPNLAAADLARFPVPLPPLAEQNRIVAAVERYDTIFASVDASLCDQQVLASHLRSSLLSAAFSGRLVSQDFNDEPASALLERICSEQASGEHEGPVGTGPRQTRKTRISASDRDARRTGIQLMWEDGYSMAEIAETMEISSTQLGNELARMRKEGWNLPYRRRKAPA